MKYLLATFMSILILTFVACGDDVEDTAVADTAVEADAGGADASEGEGEGESSDAGPGADAGAGDAADDDLDGGSEDE